MTDPRDQRRMLDALKEIEDLKQEIANHIAVNSLLTDSDGEADLANKLYNIQFELKRKDEENKALEEMYANTFAKLRDLEKEFSDMKANLHRAYNGLQNYKKIKSETAQLKEALKEMIPLANSWYDYLKVFESWAKDDNPPPNWFAKLPEHEEAINNARNLIELNTPEK